MPDFFPVHFSQSKLTLCPTAIRLGLANEPDLKTNQNLYRLAAFLDRLEKQIQSTLVNARIDVLSAYRAPKVNVALKGSRTSYHMLGLAADITCTHIDSVTLAGLIASRYSSELAEVIYEGRKWVHVALKQRDNDELRLSTSEFTDGKVLLLKGL